mgnify:CR=1 FL=1
MIITISRKPLIKSVCENITLHNIGGININSCRLGGNTTVNRKNPAASMGYHKSTGEIYTTGSDKGRWPANFILNKSLKDILPDNVGGRWGKGSTNFKVGTIFSWANSPANVEDYLSNCDSRIGDVGHASRFFFMVKE